MSADFDMATDKGVQTYAVHCAESYINGGEITSPQTMVGHLLDELDDRAAELALLRAQRDALTELVDGLADATTVGLIRSQVVTALRGVLAISSGGAR